MRIVVTGGLGFIGSHLIRWLLANQPQVEVINIDVLTYAGNRATLGNVEQDPRYRWERVSIGDRGALERIFSEKPVDAVMHLAAESHVDRSITNGTLFVETNVLGTALLLEIARKHGVSRFLHVSTDEVYGSLGSTGYFSEASSVDPRSPYSASKASSDLLALAAFHTFSQDVVVTRCSNNYGPYQFPEKLIPLFITNGLEHKPWPLYGDGMNIRDWLYVEDHVRALWMVFERGRAGEVYNIGGHNEKTNREVAEELRHIMDLPEDIIQTVTDRLGHDRRYAIDPTKITQEIGWEPQFTWDNALRLTVQWYRDHREWWEPIKGGTYQDYYQQQYGNQLTGKGTSSRFD